MHHMRDSHLITAAVGVSALGDFLLWVPLTLHLQETTDSGLAVAGLFICLWAPAVVLAGVAGLVVDRREARGVLLVASVAQALIAGGLALALDSTAAILALCLLLGCGFALAQPAEFSLVPVIAGPESATVLNGHVETARYLGMAAGPVLGGVLAGVGGIEVAMLVNAATFLVVAVAALLLHARRPPVPAQDGDRERARDGVVHLVRDPELRLVVGVLFVSLLFMSATITAEVFFLKEDLGVGDTVYGLLFATWMAGMIGGSLVVARRVPARLLVLAVLVATAVQGAGVGLPTAWLLVGFAAAMWFVGGLGHGAKNVLARSLIQQRVPERLHGRAFAAYNGMRNGAELFALAAGGALVAVLGGRATMALAGGLSLLAALVGLLLYRRARSAPAPVGPATALADA